MERPRCAGTVQQRNTSCCIPATPRRARTTYYLETEMKISALAGWSFTALTSVAFALFILGSIPYDRGYTLSERHLMDDLFASAEYEARLVDIQKNVTPLSLADLERLP
jgi:hypothetical protein